MVTQPEEEEEEGVDMEVDGRRHEGGELGGVKEWKRGWKMRMKCNRRAWCHGEGEGGKRWKREMVGKGRLRREGSAGEGVRSEWGNMREEGLMMVEGLGEEEGEEKK